MLSLVVVETVLDLKILIDRKCWVAYRTMSGDLNLSSMKYCFVTPQATRAINLFSASNNVRAALFSITFIFVRFVADWAYPDVSYFGHAASFSLVMPVVYVPALSALIGSLHHVQYLR